MHTRLGEARSTRIFLLFEPTRSGVEAVKLARELASDDDATVTIVGVAPQAPRLRRCTPSAKDYNATVRATVASELEQAGKSLWGIGSRADCRLLVEGEDESLEELVARERPDLVLLPGRRRLLRGIGHPAAVRLSACAATEVRVVDPDR